ncbi:MAG: hypothetical protein GXY76_23515 [Chloroflexi bacterium]|nr:hypothetical protein [Chloroflexota bacterium]
MGGNRRMLAALLGLLALAALLAIVVLDPGGWGGFLRDWAITLIPQTAAAVLLWCLAVLAFYLLRAVAGVRPPMALLDLLFPLAAAASLWALRVVYGWEPDTYDYLWAIIMVAVFFLWPAPRAFLRREFLAAPVAPPRARPQPFTPTQPSPAAIFDDARLSPRARGSFRQLLSLVEGDRAEARRLVLRARDLDPSGSDADWVDAAIDELLDQQA